MPFDEFDRFFEKRFRIPESLPAQSPGRFGRGCFRVLRTCLHDTRGTDGGRPRVDHQSAHIAGQSRLDVSFDEGFVARFVQAVVQRPNAVSCNALAVSIVTAGISSSRWNSAGVNASDNASAEEISSVFMA